MDFGAPPGRKLTLEAAQSVLTRIAEDATDLFSSSARALEYLNHRGFDDHERSAIDLIQSGAAASVIGRLDELRFGTQG